MCGICMRSGDRRQLPVARSVTLFNLAKGWQVGGAPPLLRRDTLRRRRRDK